MTGISQAKLSTITNTEAANTVPKQASLSRADVLTKYAQNLPPLVVCPNKVAPNPPSDFSSDASPGTSVVVKTARQNPQITAKSRSVLDDQPSQPHAEAEALRDFTEADLTQVFDQERLRFQNKLSSFTPFVRPNGRQLEPWVPRLTKDAALPMSPTAAPAPAQPATVQQAHQQMNALMSPAKACPAGSEHLSKSTPNSTPRN